jgi:acetyl/propionyl-CoA carboxylase alpha subunit
MAEKYLVRLGDENATLELDRRDGRTLVRRDGEDRWKDVQLERVGDSGLYLLMVDSHPVELYLERRRGGAVVTIGRHAFDYDVGPWRAMSAGRAKEAAASGLARITAPMTGSIVEVRCATGEAVAAGAVLLVIESMKMNNELRSPAAGIIEAAPVTPGQRVNAGELLVSVRVGKA